MSQIKVVFFVSMRCQKQIQNMIPSFPPILRGQVSDKISNVSEKWNFYYNENISEGRRVLGLSVYPTKRCGIFSDDIYLFNRTFFLHWGLEWCPLICYFSPLIQWGTITGIVTDNARIPRGNYDILSKITRTPTVSLSA